MAKVQTWIIIVKMKVGEQVDFPSPYAIIPKKNHRSNVEIEESRAVLIDRPTVIIPDGGAEKVEIIPVTGPAVLHGKDFERRLNQ